MFDKWLKLPAHYYLKITALVILTVGVCLHNTLMSIATIWLGANWLIEAKYKFYWQKFKSTPAIWFLIGLLVYSFITLAWSEDVGYGLKDIGKKMPFFVIPFVLGTSEPIEKKILHFLFYLLIGILLLTSGINFYRFYFTEINSVDVRDMSYFISHIRFAIVVVMGIIACIYLILKNKGPKILWVISALWFVYYSYVSQSLTAYVLVFSLILFTAIFGLKKIKSKMAKVSVLVGVCIGLLVIVYGFNLAFQTYKAPVSFSLSDLDKTTINGRKYYHNLESVERENGQLIWIYMQQEELENEWNRRSEIAYDSLDRLGQPMFGTLMRYLSSKGERKDSLGVWSLTENEVKLIENGKTSIEMSTGWKAKLYEFMYTWDSYKKGGDINGQSILQRIEHLRIGSSILKKNWLFGVGIGDIHQEFQKTYDQQKSTLSPENRHRSHNQFLSYWISHGIVGFILIVALVLAPIRSNVQKGFLFWSTFMVLVLSMLFQDLLETQAGVCIFALCYSMAAFNSLHESNESESKEI